MHEGKKNKKRTFGVQRPARPLNIPEPDLDPVMCVRAAALPILCFWHSSLPLLSEPMRGKAEHGSVSYGMHESPQ